MTARRVSSTTGFSVDSFVAAIRLVMMEASGYGNMSKLRDNCIRFICGMVENLKGLIMYRKTLIMSLLFGPFALLSDEITMRPLIGNVDWTDGDNFEGGSAPKANDTVIIPTKWISGIGWPAVSNSVGDASFSCISTLSKIKVQSGASFVITVPAGTSAEFPVSVTGSGTLVKAGSGELKLTSAVATTKDKSTTYDDLEVNLTVAEGKLTLPVREEGATLLTHNYLSVHVEKGAVLQTVQNGNMTIKQLTGGGTVRNDGTKQIQLVINGSPPSFCSVFDGLITGLLSVDARASHVTLLNEANDFSGGISMRHNGLPSLRRLAIPLLGMKGAPSPVGTANKLAFGSGGGALHYIGEVPSTSDKSLGMSELVNVLDAGAHGGLRLTGVFEAYSNTKTLNKLYLTGSNTVPCEIAGFVRSWKVDDIHRPFYITKQGTGTWIFNQSSDGNSQNMSRGVIAVEEGTVEFTSIAESNKFCSLGVSTDLYQREADTPSDEAHVGYAYLLGGSASNGEPTEGRMRYIGSDPAQCSTRPIALKTDGALAVTASRKLRLFDVRTEGVGAKRLALEAAEGAVGDLFDIFDSAESPISIVKRGAGVWRIGGKQALHGGVTVEGGTLVVENMAADSPYSWFRFSVKEVVAGCERYSNYTGKYFTNYNFNKADAALNVSELGLFDVKGYRLGIGISDVDHEYLVSRGNCAYVNPDRIKSEPYDSSSSYCLFDNRKETATGTFCGGLQLALKKMPKKDTPSTWFPIVFRVTNGTPEAVSWDFVNTRALYGALEGSLLEVQRQVTAARLEGSADGVHWDVLSDVDVEVPEDEVKKYVWVSNHEAWSSAPTNRRKLSDGKGFALSRTTPVHAPAPWLNVAHLSVAGGAVLRFEGVAPLVSNLSVDMKSGVGTVQGVKFAASGVLNVVSCSFEGHSVSLPLGFAQAEGAENLSKWTIKIDGEAIPSRLNVSVASDGSSITVSKIGMTIVVR